MYPSAEGQMRVFAALERGIERSRQLLFERFDFGVWLRFGFIIFLANLAGGGSGGGSGGGGLNSGGPGVGNPGSFPNAVNQLHAWLMENLILVLVGAGSILLIGFGIALVVLWLGSRGGMMLIRAVATGDSGIERNWGATRREANSVFKFRVVLLIVGGSVFLGIFVAAAAVVFGVAATEARDVWAYVIPLWPIFLGLILTALVLGIIEFLLKSFVMPLMYKDGLRCGEGWAAFGRMASGNWLRIVGFFLLRVCYSIAFMIAATLIGCFTCCIGLLPVVHQTLFAPYYLFDRSVSLYLIHELGPDFAIFEAEELPSPEEKLPPGVMR